MPRCPGVPALPSKTGLTCDNGAGCMTEQAARGHESARSFVDRSVLALNEAGAPRTTSELLTATGHADSIRSATLRLERDDRLVRTDRNTWSLAEWGAEPYRPLDAGLSDLSPTRRRRRHRTPGRGTGDWRDNLPPLPR